MAAVGAALSDAERAVGMWLDDHPDHLAISAGLELFVELRVAFDDIVSAQLLVA